MKLIFASNNENKIKEVKAKLSSFNIIGLKAFGIEEDIPETAKTIEGNASIKSTYIYKNYNIDCFSDDTGLEIEALNGEPGVYSARYAGEEKNADKNMELVLQKLKDSPNRKARFKTVVSLFLDGKEHIFTGIVNGIIIEEKRGAKGFGYDPIFVPDGYSQTFAELPLEEKNKISHRALAVDQLVEFLSNKKAKE